MSKYVYFNFHTCFITGESSWIVLTPLDYCCN